MSNRVTINRSLDLSIDEIVQQLIDLIHQMKAARVVIYSLSGFDTVQQGEQL